MDFSIEVNLLQFHFLFPQGICLRLPICKSSISVGEKPTDTQTEEWVEYGERIMLLAETFWIRTLHISLVSLISLFLTSGYMHLFTISLFYQIFSPAPFISIYISLLFSPYLYTLRSIRRPCLEMK